MTIVAHAIGISGVPWGKTWLELRAAQGLHADRWGVLQPNVDKKYRPILQTTMTAERVTRFVRHVAKVEMHMDDEATSFISSHSCKPSWLTVTGKRGVAEDIRRIMGYHASGRAQCVELYSRESWTHPMRILGTILEEIRRNLFMPDETQSRRYADGYDPFAIPIHDQLPTAKAASAKRMRTTPADQSDTNVSKVLALKVQLASIKEEADDVSEDTDVEPVRDEEEALGKEWTEEDSWDTLDQVFLRNPDVFVEVN